MKKGGKIRVGFIGTGKISTSHLRVLAAHEGVEIGALCDLDRSSLESKGNEFGVEALYDSHHAMLAAEKLDAVFVCTPTIYHTQPVMDALAGGLHVFCEKPLGPDQRQSARMLQAAKKARRLLMVGMPMRFTPQHQFLRRCVEEGFFGKIHQMSFVRRKRRNVPARPWFTDLEKGGGVLRDLGIHSLDLLMWLSGQWNPERVSAILHCIYGNRGKNFIRPDGQNGIHLYSGDDQATGMVRFAEGGVCNFEVAWATDLEECHTYEIVGDKGGMVLNYKDTEQPLKLFGEHHGTLVDILPHVPRDGGVTVRPSFQFIEAIKNGQPSPCPAVEAVAVMALIDSIYASAKSGREVVVKHKPVEKHLHQI